MTTTLCVQTVSQFSGRAAARSGQRIEIDPSDLISNLMSLLNPSASQMDLMASNLANYPFISRHKAMLEGGLPPSINPDGTVNNGIHNLSFLSDLQQGKVVWSEDRDKHRDELRAIAPVIVDLIASSAPAIGNGQRPMMAQCVTDFGYAAFFPRVSQDYLRQHHLELQLETVGSSTIRINITRNNVYSTRDIVFGTSHSCVEMFKLFYKSIVAAILGTNASNITAAIFDGGKIELRDPNGDLVGTEIFAQSVNSPQHPSIFTINSENLMSVTLIPGLNLNQQNQEMKWSSRLDTSYGVSKTNLDRLVTDNSANRQQSSTVDSHGYMSVKADGPNNTTAANVCDVIGRVSQGYQDFLAAMKTAASTDLINSSAYGVDLGFFAANVDPMAENQYVYQLILGVTEGNKLKVPNATSVDKLIKTIHRYVDQMGAPDPELSRNLLLLDIINSNGLMMGCWSSVDVAVQRILDATISTMYRSDQSLLDDYDAYVEINRVVTSSDINDRVAYKPIIRCKLADALDNVEDFKKSAKFLATSSNANQRTDTRLSSITRRPVDDDEESNPASGSYGPSSLAAPGRAPVANTDEESSSESEQLDNYDQGPQHAEYSNYPIANQTEWLDNQHSTHPVMVPPPAVNVYSRLSAEMSLTDRAAVQAEARSVPYKQRSWQESIDALDEDAVTGSCPLYDGSILVVVVNPGASLVSKVRYMQDLYEKFSMSVGEHSQYEVNCLSRLSEVQFSTCMTRPNWIDKDSWMLCNPFQRLRYWTMVYICNEFEDRTYNDLMGFIEWVLNRPYNLLHANYFVELIGSLDNENYETR